MTRDHTHRRSFHLRSIGLGIAIALFAVSITIGWRVYSERGGNQPSQERDSENVPPEAEQIAIQPAAGFADEDAERYREEQIEVLQDDPNAVLAPRWDSLYRGYDASADSISMAKFFRETDSTWEENARRFKAEKGE